MQNRFELNILISPDGELFPYTRKAACRSHVLEIIQDALEDFDSTDLALWDASLADQAKKEAGELQRSLDKDDLDGAWQVYRHGLDNDETSQVRGEDGWRWEVHQCLMPEVKP